MTLYMETTKISADKTVQEIGALLGGTGFVETVQTKHENGKPAALAFSCRIGKELVHFKLPARIEPVFQILHKKRSPMNRGKEEFIEKDREQAERVAWRQVLRWVQAQLALIDLEMVTVSEVFMAYAMLGAEETLHDRWLEGIHKGRFFPVPKGEN